jgi:hypothetical protein
MSEEIPRKSAQQEIDDYEAEVNSALKNFALRERYEPATEETPLSALLETDSGDLDEWALRAETIRGIGNYCAQSGPEPWRVMQLFYALMVHMGVKPYCLLTVRERAKMLGDSHGMEHWRMQQFCVNPLRRKGAHSTLAPGGKGQKAAAAASDAQQGNNNRRCKHRLVKRDGITACRKCKQSRKNSIPTPRFSIEN